MSIVLSLIVFSVLVLIHEFGHFLLAKRNGIGVTEFSLGMGPRIASFNKGGTRYSWKLIPFGGSCMMVGEDEDSDKDDSFNKKSVWARISVVAAGPIFNFLLALVLSIVIIGLKGYDRCDVTTVTEGSPAEEAGISEGDIITRYDGKKIVIARDLWLYQYMNSTTEEPVKISYINKEDGKEYTKEISPAKKYSMGVSYYADDESCKITEIVKDSAADKAGMKKDDIIISVEGNEISSGAELASYFDKNPLKENDIKVKVKSDGKEKELTLSPKEVYYTGFNYSLGRVKTNAFGTLRYSFTELRYNVESTLKGFKMLITGKANKDDVSGPVGIVSIVGDAYKESKSDGLYYVFLNIAFLTVLFSVNLGVLNLMPFPALDGGRLVFLFIEAVRGKPVPREKEAIVHFAGMIILMILMVFILFNDIHKLI